MANIFTQNPMIVDTAWTTGTIPAALTAELNNGPQAFKKIVWEGGTALDVVTITDAGGNILFNQECPVTGQDVLLWESGNGAKYTFKQSKWVVSAIPHGKVLFYK